MELKRLIFLKEDTVLILIIMEDTHGETNKSFYMKSKKVLILIIMEDTHGVNMKQKQLTNILACLNPYYNGRYSWRLTKRP